MRKIVLTTVGAALLALSSAQIASASEHHRHVRKAPAPASEQFRNANNSVAWPTQAPSIYSGGWSAPAGPY